LKTLQPIVNNKIIATCFPISLHTQLKLLQILPDFRYVVMQVLHLV